MGKNSVVCLGKMRAAMLENLKDFEMAVSRVDLKVARTVVCWADY